MQSGRAIPARRRRRDRPADTVARLGSPKVVEIFSNMPMNAGLQLWHMSKALSAVMALGGETAERVAEAESGGWGAADLSDLQAIAREAAVLAAQASDDWLGLQSVAASFAPGLIEPTDRGTAVIHNHGEQPACMKALNELWRDVRCVEEARALRERLTRVAGSRGQT
jgi:hypothetical protein